MTILADEGIDRDIVDRLRGDGHDVSYVAEMEPGLPDEQVLARANAGQSELVATMRYYDGACDGEQASAVNSLCLNFAE